ncbi:unnamed protein product [Heligmosomoides polygyrus]|uniref:Uncharacterized protein n=1 Tax=Heligmosomoides polygyrus TaxID=6339 RepID=A0A183FVZ0_HELPZ|nr:unnamed protein product [Heligmosomoides polygyrus]
MTAVLRGYWRPQSAVSTQKRTTERVREKERRTGTDGELGARMTSTDAQEMDNEWDARTTSTDAENTDNCQESFQIFLESRVTPRHSGSSARSMLTCWLRGFHALGGPSGS